MSWIPTFSEKIRSLLFGTPFGAIFPPAQNPASGEVDGRTHALRILRSYIAELTFRRSGDFDKATGKRGAPVEFRIPEGDVYVEWPDNEDDLRFPSVALLATAPAIYASIGLTPRHEEETRDVYGPGTVLYWISEYTETISLEVWTSSRAERRAIKAGLEFALVPVEQMYGIRFRMPDYFDELVCFTLQGVEVIDDETAARNRRRLRMSVEMRFNMVALANYAVLTPFVGLEIGPTVETDPNVPPRNTLRDGPALPRDPADACGACPACGRGA